MYEEEEAKRLQRGGVSRRRSPRIFGFLGVASAIAVMSSGKPAVSELALSMATYIFA